MYIKLTRLERNNDSIDGRISINGAYVCDSLECASKAILPGEYRVLLCKCKQYGRRMPLIATENSRFDDCENCRKLWTVSNNTVLPRVCPMLKPGNGVYGRTDGSIIVGLRCAPGFLIQPESAFVRLFDRIRKSLACHETVTLSIKET